MAKKKDKPKKKPVSPNLLAKLAGSVRSGQAFPPSQPTMEQVALAEIAKANPTPKLTKAPNRSKKHQLVFRISDELAKELKDGAFTARKSQTEIVEEAIQTALQSLRAKHGDFLDADAS